MKDSDGVKDSAVWAIGVTTVIAAALSPLLVVVWLARSDHHALALAALVVYAVVYFWVLTHRLFRWAR